MGLQNNECFESSASLQLVESEVIAGWRWAWEWFLLLLLCFVAGGNPPPAINEAHYLVKAKSYWQPDWLAHDLFVGSPKEHIAFYLTVGVLTQVVSLEATAWIGRMLGWALLAAGLLHCSTALLSRRYASLAAGVFWIVATQQTNLAGEWVVGGIEGKVFAYGLVLLGLGQMLRDRWCSTWILLGTAAAFHVLVGGWSVLLAGGVRMAQRWSSVDSFKVPRYRELLALVLGGTISLVGLLPGLALNHDTTPQEATIAAHTYVYGRLTHHLSPAHFPLEWFLRHGGIVAATAFGWYWIDKRVLGAARLSWERLIRFWCGAVALALIGLLISLLPAVAPGLAARLLRFYWFRMTDSISSLAAAFVLTAYFCVPRGGVALASGVLMLCSLLLLAPIFGAGEMSEDSIAEEDWLAVCAWIRESTDTEAVFITPRHQQTFKWYAERAEVVNWKDIPQDAKTLIEWATRINAVFPREYKRERPPLDSSSLQQLAQTYQADYLVIDCRRATGELALPKVYPASQRENRTFAIYRLGQLD